jgi:hypothetical protein
MRLASIPFFAKNKINMSRAKNVIKINTTYQTALYKAGKIKAEMNNPMIPKSA